MATAEYPHPSRLSLRLHLVNQVSTGAMLMKLPIAPGQPLTLHIFVTSAPSCINFGTPEKPEGVFAIMGRSSSLCRQWVNR